MARIFIFRHGQTADNLNKIFSGWRNPDLTENGVKEAQVLREKLKDEKVTKAYSSTQTRSIHTLSIALEGHQGVQIFQDERIRERDYGDLTGQSKTKTEEENPEQFKLWHRSYNVPPPNGESIEMVEKRVMPFLNEVLPTFTKDDVVFISASANSIRPMRKFFEHMDNEQIVSYEYEPAQIFEYQI